MTQPETGFDTERYRRQLFKNGQFKLLRQTYTDSYPIIPTHNTPKKWDQLLTHHNPHHLMAQHRQRLISHHIQSHTTVLNLGVGQGKLEELIWKRWQNQVLWTGTDFTYQTLDQVATQYPAWNFIRCQLTNLPFTNHKFDQVLLLEVLEHVQPTHTFRVLAEISRVIKPGGELIVSVPLNEGLEAKFPDNPNQHARVYVPELLVWELNETGFEVNQTKQLTAFSSWFQPRSFFNRIFKLRSSNNLIVFSSS